MSPATATLRARALTVAWRGLRHVARAGGVLSYHGVTESLVSPELHVTAATLRTQLEQLATEFRVIPLRELLARHAAGRSVAGCLALTFDDAYEGLARVGAPFLTALGLPATVLVVADAARSAATFWWDELEALRVAADAAPWDALAAQLGFAGLPRTADGFARLRTRVLARHVGRCRLGALAPRLPAERRAATFAELRAWASRDAGVEFACHTMTHPALPFLDEAEQVREIGECSETLRGELPRVLEMLAYPYGLYDARTIAAARRAGIRCGLTMDGRAPSRHMDAMQVPRLGIMEERPAASVGLRLSAVLRPLMVLRDGAAHARLPEDPVDA